MKYEEYITNGNSRGRGPAEIDSDLAEIRWEMSETLHLLEDKFSPRALLEQLFSRARGAGHGSSEFVGNLGATIRDNPVPVLLLASGVVSLLAADRTGGGGAAQRGPTSAEGTVGEDIDEFAHSVEGKAESMRSRARGIAGAVGERAHGFRERAGEQASEFGERASEMRAHARETGTAARERVRDAMHETRERGGRTLEEQPLIIVGLGLALGAMLGASIPVSERERRIVGREGDKFIRRGESAIGRAKEAVQAGVERAADVATRRTEEAGPQRASSEVAPVIPVVHEALPEPGEYDVGQPSETRIGGERPGGTREP